MAKFRKKPVVIEAIQVRAALTSPREALPAWWDDQIIQPAPIGLYVITLEGRMQASLDDWIIQGVKGELYPCRDDIFRATYEAGDWQAADGAWREAMEAKDRMIRERDEARAALAAAQEAGLLPGLAYVREHWFHSVAPAGGNLAAWLDAEIARLRAQAKGGAT